MGKRLSIGAMIVTVCLPAWLSADPGKYAAAVVLPEIQMRAGASWQYPPTGKLKKGEQVIVHHEDGSWVAIVPPPGTVSWVNHRFLGEFDPNSSAKQNALLMADNVEVRLGSEKGPPLAVTQVKLPRGTWVEITAAKLRDENTTWYPITPPEGEYRWLPKEALGSPSPLAPPPVFVKSDGTSPTKTPGSLTSLGSRPAGAAQIPQWNKAEQAEQAGDYATAEKFYTLIYQDLRQKNGDAETILICYNRIIKCQDRMKLDGISRSTPPTDISKPSALLQAPKGSSTGTVGVAWPNDSNATAPNGDRSTGPGNLRRAPFTIDGKQAYALEKSPGQVLYYVTASSGVSLDVWVNRQVDLVGKVQVRGDIRGGQYMVVTAVNPVK